MTELALSSLLARNTFFKAFFGARNASGTRNHGVYKYDHQKQSVHIIKNNYRMPLKKYVVTYVNSVVRTETKYPDPILNRTPTWTGHIKAQYMRLRVLRRLLRSKTIIKNKTLIYNT